MPKSAAFPMPRGGESDSTPAHTAPAVDVDRRRDKRCLASNRGVFKSGLSDLADGTFSSSVSWTEVFGIPSPQRSRLAARQNRFAVGGDIHRVGQFSGTGSFDLCPVAGLMYAKLSV